MIEIKNKTRGPIPIIVRSKNGPREFTTLAIPGTGSGKNVIYLEDEKKTEYIERLEDRKLITIRVLPDK